MVSSGTAVPYTVLGDRAAGAGGQAMCLAFEGKRLSGRVADFVVPLITRFLCVCMCVCDAHYLLNQIHSFRYHAIPAYSNVRTAAIFGGCASWRPFLPLGTLEVQQQCPIHVAPTKSCSPTCPCSDTWQGPLWANL